MLGRQKKVVDQASSYLKATDTVSRPVAIMLTLATMVIILALLFLAYLGGRWVYRKVWGAESQGTTTQTVNVRDENNRTPPRAGSVGVGVGTGGSGGDLQPTGQVSNNSSEEPENVPAAGGDRAPAPAVIPDTGPGLEYEP